MENIDYVEEYDKMKTKVLKYIIYKKRTEKEVRQKFSSTIDEELLDDIIEELKDIGYIDDANYIKRAVQEFIALKNMSLKEIRYKLFSKGLDNNIIEDYILSNEDELTEYEIQSAKNIILKKKYAMEEDEIKQFLFKKGYRTDIVKEAFRNLDC